MNKKWFLSVFFSTALLSVPCQSANQYTHGVFSTYATDLMASHDEVTSTYLEKKPMETTRVKNNPVNNSSDAVLSTAAEKHTYTAPTILADLLLLRPVGTVLTLLGTGLFIAVSPITALSAIAPPHDSFERVGMVLIAAPAAFTWTRPLGEYTRQLDSGR